MAGLRVVFALTVDVRSRCLPSRGPMRRSYSRSRRSHAAARCKGVRLGAPLRAALFFGAKISGLPTRPLGGLPQGALITG